MTIATWPAEFPQRFLYEGFSRIHGDGRLRTPTDTGPGKRRLVNSAAPMSVQAQVYLTRDHLARFDRFWDEDLGRGVLPFYILDQVNNGLELTDENGNPITNENDNVLTISAWWLVQFGAPPAAPVKSNKYFRLSLDLEILP